MGWFAYSPLTAKAFSRGHSTDYWSLAIFAAGIGTIASAVNIVTTVICMRCPGMTLRRMPLLPWMMLTMAAMTLIVMTPLSAAQIMLSIDRYLGGHFFDTQAGGSAVLWQHFFWVFGHPEVYVLIIPGFAFASEIIPVFSRKAIFGYPAMVAAVTGIGFLSFGVWAHHMFTVGMTSHANTFFALITMAVGIPTGIKIFNWLGTLWGGKIRFATPMLFCLAFLFQFLVAGLTGIMLASVPFDWQLSDSYFVVAHFHYVLLGALVMTIFGALYYWFPKATGRMLSERLGRWHFWLFVIGFHLTFDTMHIPGLLGMPRRIYTYEADRGWGIFNLVSTVGVVFQAAGDPRLPLEHGARAAPRPSRRQRSVGRLDPRVGRDLASALLQLREAAGRAEPPAALGFQAPGRSRLEVRMSARSIRADAIASPPERWELPERGPVGMICLIIAEAAIFLIFVVAYLFYLGKSATGPQPKDVLDLPIFLTICLLSSSATIGLAVARPAPRPERPLPRVVGNHDRPGRDLPRGDRPRVEAAHRREGPDDPHEPLRNHLLLARRSARLPRHGRAALLHRRARPRPDRTGRTRARPAHARPGDVLAFRRRRLDRRLHGRLRRGALTRA